MTLRHGGWDVDLLHCGAIELPGEALGPEFGETAMLPVLASLWRGHGHTVLVDAGAGSATSSGPVLPGWAQRSRGSAS